MLNDAARKLYRRYRGRGMKAGAAFECATRPRLDYRENGETLVLDLGEEIEREGLTVTVSMAPDQCPDVSWLGEFTDTWSRDALVNSHNDSNAYRYFVPGTTVGEHRRALSDLGYARGVAHALAVSYAREDMTTAREPEMFTVKVAVSKAGVTLATEYLGGVALSDDEDRAEQVAHLVRDHGMVDTALEEARDTLSTLAA